MESSYWIAVIRKLELANTKFPLGAGGEEKRNMKEYMPLPIDEKAIIFETLEKGDDLLFLYDVKMERYNGYRSFIGNGLENGEICMYAFKEEMPKWYPTHTFKKYIESNQFHVHPITDMPSLDNKVAEIHDLKREEDILRFLIDFCNITDLNEDDVVSCGKKIINKSKEIPLVAITAFNVSVLDHDIIRRLMTTHEKVLFFTQSSGIGVVLPTFSFIKPLEESSVQFLSHEIIESFVKKNLEIIILYSLSKTPRCGYELIRDIARRFHVFLSQGTVYPLLYSLREKGFLEIKMGKNRAKIYIPTEQGEAITRRRLDEFRTASRHLLNLIE